MALILGQQAKDKITGFKGKITARHIYITGCDQYTLTPDVNKQGEYQDQCQFDEGRIEIIGKGVSLREVQIKGDPGGPQMPSRCIK